MPGDNRAYCLWDHPVDTGFSVLSVPVKILKLTTSI